jgi:hypothetical protein
VCRKEVCVAETCLSRTCLSSSDVWSRTTSRESWREKGLSLNTSIFLILGWLVHFMFLLVSQRGGGMRQLLNIRQMCILHQEDSSRVLDALECNSRGDRAAVTQYDLLRLAGGLSLSLRARALSRQVGGLCVGCHRVPCRQASTNIVQDKTNVYCT